MKVYKFGGASVRSAEGVRNLLSIVRQVKEPLVVIVSAMGKTTNAMESVVEMLTSGDRGGAQETFLRTELYHREITDALFGRGNCPQSVAGLLGEVKNLIDSAEARPEDYDLWYDRVVSYGELISTTIISEFMAAEGVPNLWLDMRRLFLTDARHRDATIDLESSAPLLCDAISKAVTEEVFVGQGFIGGTPEGCTTTLGREGSDYSAAAAAYMTGAADVTIWKDVDGILNADPRIFPDAVHIPELTYLDAIELAYSGAQIIHPKTIKPLQNRGVELHVRPFGDIAKPGSVIKEQIAGKVDVPVIIIKRRQVLISIRPNDFSFVLEDRLASIFSIFEKCNAKINLVQSSAVNLTLCVDNSRRLHEIEEMLKQQGYRVVYNTGMELLTIRGYTRELYEKYDNSPGVYLVQRTRKIIRIIRKEARA